jgi:DNA-binding XRE family transcriptional regulator
LSIRSEGLTVRWKVLNEAPATIVSVNPLEQFAANLRRCRRNRGLSQQRLAFDCKLHRTEVSLLERGDRNPRLTTIVRLARALGVPPAELLEDVA